MAYKNPKALGESINRFLDFFRNRLVEIRNLESPESTALFRKILYSGLLDALSRTAAHPKKGNRERIVDFVRIFCGWPNCEKISLPHLARLLEKVPDPAFSDLRQYAFTLFDQWDEGEVISLDKDPDFQEVERHWPKNIPKPFEDIQIEFLQHANLFYRYRNNLVHELREPGYGMEFPEDAEPFYHSMMDGDTQENTWELVYPLGFYEKLCETAINNLKDYYMNDRIEPYSCYVFGSYWIEELNR